MAVAIAVTAFTAAALSLQSRRQLATMGAFQSTWLDLGLNVAATGVFGSEAHPTVYKPPGYPLFIAGAVRTLAGKPVRCDTCDTGLHWGRLAYRRRFLESAARAVGWAQALVHALSAAALFLLLSTVARREVAAAGALFFAADPMLIVLVGATHYTTLHLWFVIVGCALLVRCLGEPTGEARALAWWSVAGLWWGLATLVRPVTLLLPPFVLAALLLVRNGRSRRATYGFGCFVLGMAVAILPCAVRNHAVAGRWIPVNAQLWTALYGSTALATQPTADRMRWRDVLPAARQVATGAMGREISGVYEPLTVGENLLLEDGYRAATLDNLRRHPGTYASNVLRSVWSYHAHTTAAYLPVFRHYQEPGGTWPRWGTPGTPADPATWPGGATYRVFGLALTLLALAGAVLGVYRRDTRILGVIAVHLCLAVAHSISWMDFTYLYLRIPFNCFFAAYLLEAGLDARASRWPRLGAIAVLAALAALLAASLVEVFGP